jgi:hypothetical protein
MSHLRTQKEVIFLQSGELWMKTPTEALWMSPCDMFTTLIRVPRLFIKQGDAETIALVVRGGDRPVKAPALDA